MEADDDHDYDEVARAAAHAAGTPGFGAALARLDEIAARDDDVSARRPRLRLRQLSTVIQWAEARRSDGREQEDARALRWRLLELAGRAAKAARARDTSAWMGRIQLNTPISHHLRPHRSSF